MSDKSLNLNTKIPWWCEDYSDLQTDEILTFFVLTQQFCCHKKIYRIEQLLF